MKKLAKILAIALSCSLFCACNANLLAPKLPDFNKALSFSAQVSVNETQYSADFVRKGTDSWKISFSSPYSLGGTVFELKDSGVLANYDGCEAAVDMGNFEKSPFYVLVRAFEETACNPDDLKLMKTQQGATADGTAGDLEFTLCLDERGAPSSLKIGAISLSADITDFEITGEVSRSDVVGVY